MTYRGNTTNFVERPRFTLHDEVMKSEEEKKVLWQCEASPRYSNVTAGDVYHCH